MTILARALRAVRDWPVESQQRSRRNAMLASTAITARRVEAAEVAELLATPHLGSAPGEPATEERAAR